MNAALVSMRDALALTLLIGGVVTVLPSARAGQADISSTPLTAVASAQVKPNVMLLMDASGSMGWSHMPDEVESTTGVTSVGYKSAQCNVLYYNPATTYPLPKKPDGSLFATPTFGAPPYAPYSGYWSFFLAPDATDSSVVNLATSFQAYDGKTLRNTTTLPDTPQPAYYYTLTGSSITPTYASAPCTDPDTGASQGASAGGGTWTRVVVSGAAQQANFAIWYSYYRTRISMIKSAASLAFTPLTDSFRVGFITMEPMKSGGVDPVKYVPIADFDSTQRSSWFNKLFSQIPGGASPAREGLARVGRHYAGMHDYINTGMTGDPVQFSCQQNFTIMTTDGYWNTQTETPGGGPVKIDGVTPVGQQDGTLTVAAGNSPRPIWDGFADGTQVSEDEELNYAYANCGSFAYLSTSQAIATTTQTLATTNQITQSTLQVQKSTVQALANTSQPLQSTSQTNRVVTQRMMSTVQHLQSTRQVVQNTQQNLQTTSQAALTTVQNRQSTTQNLLSTSQLQAITTVTQKTVTIDTQSTSQTLQTTTQKTQSTSQTKRSTTQNLQSTNQNLQSTVQNRQSTTQTTQSTAQNLKSTSQNLQSTSQVIKTSSQVATQSTSQQSATTSQTMQSTSQSTTTTTQVRQSTSQEQSCDARTELCQNVPVASCQAGGFISCAYVTTGPTLVASCTPATASAANNFTTTTCATTQTGPTGSGSCTPVAATSSNNYVKTSCTNATTGPTAVASCTSTSANAGNSWTATTCSTTPTGPTPVASCTAASPTAANNYVTTTCGNITSGPTGVAACTPAPATSANNYTTVTCGGPNSSSAPAASCAAAAPSAVNSYTTTTCATNTTTNVPVASCTASGASSSNSFVATTCGTNNATNTPVQTCSAVSPTSANNYVTTTCSTNNSGPTGVSSCASVTATALNNWTTTSCGTNNTTNVPVASCTSSSANGANSWTNTTCPAAVTTSNVPVATCTAATANSTNSYTTTTCPTPVTTTNVPVATCSSASALSTNNYVSTTCPTAVTTGPTAVSSCTAAAASSGNSYIATTCTPVLTGPTGVANCSTGSPTLANSWTTTSCGTNNTTNVAVASCTAASPIAGNGFTTTTCTPVNTGPTNVDNCSAAGATSSNSYVTTTCGLTTVSGPTVVASCTPVSPSAATGHQRTLCNVTVTTVGVSSCTPSANVTCNTATTGPTAVQTCSASVANAGNQYTATSCSVASTTNVAVQTCTATAASAANSWVATTCPAPITTGPTPMDATACASSAALVASSANGWVTSSCATTVVSNTPVAACVITPAASGNNWTAISCPTPNTTTNVGAQTCVAVPALAANSFTATTCPSPIVTTDVPVASCLAATASAANLWVRTTCRDVTTGPTGVQSCPSNIAASATNNWVATTCADNNSGPTAVASCSADPASVANSWAATTCPVTITTDVPVQICTASAPTSANSYKTTTCRTATALNTPVASCVAGAGTSANNWVTTACPTPVTTGPTAAATCANATANSGNSYVATICNNVTTGPTGVQACVPVPASLANNWVATTCGVNALANAGVQSCTPAVGSSANGWITTVCPPPAVTTGPVASCVATVAAAGNGWTSTTCSSLTSGPTLVPSCTADPASPSNSYTATTCVSAGSKKLTYQLIKTITTSQVSGGIVVSSATPVVTAGATVDLDGICYPTNIPLLPLPNPAPAGNGNPGPTPPSGCSKWPCITTTNNSGGSVNSLADVAQYYYVTDLRPTMVDNVPNVGSGPEDDRLHTQHMTTFTIGLGVSGTLTYRADYRSASATTGDFADIRTGAKSWPLWPDPSLDPLNYNNWNNPRSIDDFWHTAVNGRGQYFSAGNPASVVSGISGALSGIAARLSSGAAAGASNLQPVAGDNFAFTASYKTGDWTGDVVANAYDLSTGAVSASPAWAKSASDSLDTMTKAACDNRTIYLIRPGASTSSLVKFSSNTSVCDTNGNPMAPDMNVYLTSTELTNFDVNKVALLSQRPTMTDGSSGTVNQISAAAGANMLNFLRGQTQYLGFEAGSATKLYRDRAHVLGDIVGGQPVYVKGPSATYADSGYSAFMAGPAASRAKMVYVAANDGMLHAFHAGVDSTDTKGGQEAWAIIPSAVLPSLYKLADANYKNVHQYYVDGTPVVADVRNGSSSWRSMLVGGLNDGGKGYYAIDITDPTAPQVMWEFQYGSASATAGSAASAGDSDLGLTFGKPIVTKIKDAILAEGRWVVLLSSGYNNTATGTGHGYLYVLDANTGSVLQKIDTGAGTAAAPANLGQLNAYVDDARVNNLAVRAYGADMLGNVWNFNVNTGNFPGGVTLVGQAKDSGGNPQPITTRPELAELNGKPMIFVGTGRLLGTSDMTDTSTQSIYGIVDPLTGNPAYGDLRGSLKPMVMAVQGAGSTAARTIACSTASADAARCASTKGWVIDLPDTGERVNVDMQLALTTLVIGSNVPTGDVCSSGGHSWLNYVDFATGTSNGSFGSSGDPSYVSMYLANSLIVGLDVIQLPDGTLRTDARTNEPNDVVQILSPPPPAPAAKRISWREIPQ